MVAMVRKKGSQFSIIQLIGEKCARKVNNGWEQKTKIPVAMETNMLAW